MNNHHQNARTTFYSRALIVKRILKEGKSVREVADQSPGRGLPMHFYFVSVSHFIDVRRFDYGAIARNGINKVRGRKLLKILPYGRPADFELPS